MRELRAVLEDWLGRHRPLGRWMKVAEVARVTGWSPDTIKRLIDRGELAASIPPSGRGAVVAQDDLREFMARLKSRPAGYDDAGGVDAVDDDAVDGDAIEDIVEQIFQEAG